MTATVADVLEGRARWTVVHGDCLEVMAAMPEKCVDHVITDPPYEAEAHTKQRRVKREGGVMAIEALSFPAVTPEQREAWAAKFAALSRRWTALFCQVEAATKWGTSLDAGGARVMRIGVWVKPDAMPQYTGDRPGMGYETVVFAHAKGRARWNGGGRVGVFVHNKNSGGGRDHETQKPLPLMLELVELFTDPGEIILDPFAGSGTTGVAALRLGRRFIGVEKDARYHALAVERLRAEEAGSTLRDQRAGQVPLFGGSGHE